MTKPQLKAQDAKGLLAVCTCGHEAYMHHFSGYLGFKGDDGRGKCATTNCNCQSYHDRTVPSSVTL